MSFFWKPKKLPFFFYLSVSYIALYAISALTLYLINVHVISHSARSFDWQDVESESREFSEILRDNHSGEWLAEEIQLENFPASTIFAARVITPDGRIAYRASQPKNLSIPGVWENGPTVSPLPKVGWSKVYLPEYARKIQIKTTLLGDGRLLQVTKSTNLEAAQRRVLKRTSLVFFLLASLVMIANGFWLMLVTLRPIKQVTSEMTRIIKTGSFGHSAGVNTVSSPIAELNTLGELFNLMTQKNALLVQAMRDTLDNLAHDFRTPLARIRGTAEFSLNSQAASPNAEALLSSLADIIDDCDNAHIQLQNLMDIREMESGCVTLNLNPVDAKKLIAEIADPYTLLAENKDIALTLDLPACDAIIEGDHNRLAQMLANLVDNAVKYTPRGGQVRIALTANADHVRITVSDTGIGIPEEEHALVWQRLYRSRNARQEKGLGLGMSIVKVIVDAHGGQITLTSAPGKGSTFVLTLPTKHKIEVA